MGVYNVFCAIAMPSGLHSNTCALASRDVPYSPIFVLDLVNDVDERVRKPCFPSWIPQPDSRSALSI
jgi:hypothetical protein